MRKGWNTLSGLVVNKMGRRLQLGDCFIFCNRRRDTVKILTAEDGGLVMYIKKLSKGRFRIPDYDVGARSVTMEWRDLVLIVEGIKEEAGKRLVRLKAPRNIVEKD